jgi:hypothetical protein
MKWGKTEQVAAIGVRPSRNNSDISDIAHNELSAAGVPARDQGHRRMAMRGKYPAITGLVAGGAIVTIMSLHSMSTSTAQTTACYAPEYTDSGEMKLPPNNIWREWIWVGEPFTPNALNGGHAGFPEFHNVYIEPCSYAKYKETNVFPEGTIFFKELQLTLGPAENPDGSQTEPSGRGYFPGAFNGADVTVKDSKRYGGGGWGYYNFNHHEPKAPTAKLMPVTECAYCHIANAKKDEVWTQFYRLLDTGIGMPTPGMPNIK